MRRLLEKTIIDKRKKYKVRIPNLCCTIPKKRPHEWFITRTIIGLTVSYSCDY
jgi:hypothetical protein